MSDSEPIDYVRVSKILQYFKAKEIRVASEAKAKIQKIINSEIEKIINTIIEKLPTVSKGPNKGQLKRKTIKLEDLEGI